MISAFQRNAFQDNAYQIGVALGSGAVWFPHLWRAERNRRDRALREAEEAKARDLVDAVAFAPEVVTAQAAPVVTDLSALIASAPFAAAAPAPMAKADDGLQKFLMMMIEIAESEDEWA